MVEAARAGTLAELGSVWPARSRDRCSDAAVDAAVHERALPLQHLRQGCSGVQLGSRGAAVQIGQIAVKIRAGITEPTDTDFAASLKASLRASQSEEKKGMMEAAAAAGERASFKRSVPSLGRMLDAAWQLQEERQLQRPWTLQSLRRNGFLHWRPDFMQQKLVLAAKQKWAAELPEGS